MNKSAFLLALLVIAAALPVAQAADADAADASQDTAPAAGQSTAVGEVTVYLEEWQPDLSGMGAGLFTFTAFDFAGFFAQLADALSSLLGAA